MGVYDGELRTVTSCEPCPEGTFTAEANQTSCADWYRCSIAEQLVTAGTSTTDATCEPRLIGSGDDVAAYALVATEDGLWVAGTNESEGFVSTVSFDGLEEVVLTIADARPTELALVGGDTLVVAGTIESDVFLRRLTLTGDELWAVRFGSDETDYVAAVAEGPNDSVYLAGGTGGDLDGAGAGPFVRQYDATGNLLQNIVVDGPYLSDMTANKEGAIYLTFATADPDGRVSSFLRALDEDGVPVWEVGPEELGCRECSELFATADGDLYVAGRNLGDFGGDPDTGPASDVSLARVAPSGEVRWKSIVSYAPSDVVEALVVTDDGAQVFGSTYLDSGSESLAEAIAFRFGPDGEQLSLELREGPEHDQIQAATATPTGDVFVAGITATSGQLFPFVRHAFVVAWPPTPP